MKRDPLPAHVLATRLIPNVSADMAKQLNLKPEHKSLALITADCDDVTYTAPMYFVADEKEYTFSGRFPLRFWK